MTARPADHSYLFDRSPQGGLRLSVAGATVVLRAAGALWIETHAALIVADLHLEKGSFFAARGQMLPPYDTSDTLGRLEAEVAALAPRLIVLLGDSFHDSAGQARLSLDSAARLRALAAGREMVWIVGNHDRRGLDGVPGRTATSLFLAGLVLVHEPAGAPVAAEVAGHLHPCARVAGASASVRRRCFVTDGERLILPAFGAYAGGLNVRDAAFAGLFNRRPLTAALGAARVHAVGWRSLRGD
ncbi:MAG TPA: ligase-associated DNA damage response endonuclease PdeM [Caulobacteraceae bacterium]